jgi:hypothetical protein
VKIGKKGHNSESVNIRKQNVYLILEEKRTVPQDVKVE